MSAIVPAAGRVNRTDVNEMARAHDAFVGTSVEPRG